MRRVWIGIALIIGAGSVGDAQGLVWRRNEPQRVYRCVTVTHDTGRAFNLVDAETGVIWMALTNSVPGEPVTHEQCWWLVR